MNPNENNYYAAGRRSLDEGNVFPHLDPAEGYVPSKALQEAVNVAIMLQKPLLLTGKPGTGKTALAYHLAQTLGDEVIFFATRTDSTASDLLYRYDSLAHFQHVNLYKSEMATASYIEENFIHYQGLGKAICDSVGHNKEKKAKRRVVLLDEIDKAPRDLPNDMLTVLERMAFEVPELKAAKGEEAIWKKTGDPKLKPLVVMTSNSEKTLPEAFLRRCVFFYIDLPDEAELIHILRNKKSLFKKEDAEHFEPLVKIFRQIQPHAEQKAPATHELILWVWWMRQQGFTAHDMAHFKAIEDEDRKRLLLSGISILAKETEDWLRIRKNVENEVYKMG
jgi:MoxR-like ATPase